MTERTTVILTVPVGLASYAKDILETKASYDHKQPTKDDCVNIIFHNVSHGELLGLDVLLQKGIPFTVEWEANEFIEGGTTSLRFTETGEHFLKRIPENTDRILVDDLMRLIDDPVSLQKLIKKVHEESTIPSWENQLEYRKRFLVRQVVSPT